MANCSTLQTTEETAFLHGSPDIWYQNASFQNRKKADLEDRPLQKSRPVETASCLLWSTVSSVKHAWVSASQTSNHTAALITSNEKKKNKNQIIKHKGHNWIWVTTVWLCVETDLEGERRRRNSVFMSSCAHSQSWRLVTTGRGVSSQIPLNLGNHFVSSVKMNAKERFRTVPTSKTLKLSTVQIILLFVNVPPTVLY